MGDTIHVQFSDAKQTIITGYFSTSPPLQDTANSGTVETSDTRYKTYFDSLSTCFQVGMIDPS